MPNAEIFHIEKNLAAYRQLRIFLLVLLLAFIWALQTLVIHLMQFDWVPYIGCGMSDVIHNFVILTLVPIRDEAVTVLPIWLIMRLGCVDCWTYLTPCILYGFMLLSGIASLYLGSNYFQEPAAHFLVQSLPGTVQLGVLIFLLSKALRLRLCPKKEKPHAASLSIQDLFIAMTVLSITWTFQNFVCNLFQNVEFIRFSSLGTTTTYSLVQSLAWIGCIGILAVRNSRRYVIWILLGTFICLELAMEFHFMLVTEPQIMGESSWRWIPASPASRLWQFIQSIVYLFSSIIFSVLLLRWACYEFTECSKQVYESKSVE